MGRLKIQSEFKIEIEKEGKKEEKQIVMQELSPFVVGDIFSSSLAENGKIEIGNFVQKAIEKEIIISPKNLKEILEEADNGFELISKIFGELNEFCGSPKLYKLKKDEAKRKKQDKSVEPCYTESDIDRNKKHE